MRTPKFQKMEISTYLNYCITHGCWQPNLIMTWWTVDQESKWYRFCRGWCARSTSLTLDQIRNPWQFQKMEISILLEIDCITHGCWQPNLMHLVNRYKNPNDRFGLIDGWCASHKFLWINENPMEDGQFLLTWIIVLLMDVDSRIWSRWLGEPLIKNPNGTDFVEDDVLVTSLLWINENPHNFRRWKFLLTWIIVLLMDVDSRIWWLGEPLIKNPNGTDFVEGDVLVTSLLWINENPQ